MVLCHQFNDYAKSDWVKTARTAYVPTWRTDREEMKARTGSVFLCGEETFPSFYPVYTFLAANEHYSNPACRFKQRYDFLDLLEDESDPRIVNLALRKNRYDAVDFFMPHREGGVFDVTISLSNYPNRYFTRSFKWPESLLADTLLFKHCKGDNLYQVMAPPDTASPLTSYSYPSGGDTLVQSMHLALIRDQLTTSGQAELDAYTRIDWSRWLHPPQDEIATVFGDLLALKDVRLVADGDSLHLLMAFEAIETLSRQFRIMVHVFVGDQMNNFDFDPASPTYNWGRYETVICRRTIPKPAGEYRLLIGVFDQAGNLPGVARVDSDKIK
jgi:hypothetical protein